MRLLIGALTASDSSSSEVLILGNLQLYKTIIKHRNERDMMGPNQPAYDDGKRWGHVKDMEIAILDQSIDHIA